MKRLLIAALLSAPLLAHADTYRCKQPNGSLSFQDHPCSAGAHGSTYDMPTAQGYAPPPGATAPQPGAGGDGTESANQRIKAYNDQVNAQNRAARCHSARNSLGILKEPVRAYTRDNNGDRVYIEDKDRSAAIAAAQESVDANCQ
jgi:hypothetical protein